jgi:phosphopantothenoylcysteine synthetase/decarboxylase
MLKGKKVIVTGGGTQEFIDDVRVLTNISTGRTACTIVDQLVADGATVTFLHGITSDTPAIGKASCIGVRTAAEALDKLKDLCLTESPSAVVHCMAVSDFTFKRDNAIKLKSNKPMAFIDYLRDNIIMNPKIIGHIKEWAPSTVLIGFKFEVGISTEQLKAYARGTIERNGCSLVIANDKVAMEKSGTHVAHFVYSEDIKKNLNLEDTEVSGNSSIARNICEFLEKAIVQE